MMAAFSTRARVLLALVATVVLLGGAVGYAVAVRSSDPVTPSGSVSLETGPRLLFLSGRHVATVDSSDPPGPAAIVDAGRVRVSASGRMVSWTSFISGESYNRDGVSRVRRLERPGYEHR